MTAEEAKAQLGERQNCLQGWQRMCRELGVPDKVDITKSEALDLATTPSTEVLSDITYRFIQVLRDRCYDAGYTQKDWESR